MNSLWLRVTIFAGVVVVLAGQATLWRGLSAQSPTTVISGGTLIDGTGAPPLANASLIIRNGRISDILSGVQGSVPAGAHVIDATGKTIIPGFIDGHIHYRPWQGELCLANGVTTVIDLGNADEWVRALIEGRNLGQIRMPRMYASGSRLGATVETRRTKLIQPVASHKPHFVFLDVEKAKELIREKKKNGLHIIKVDETWSKDDLKQLADLAHSLGMPLVGHSTDPSESAVAGQDAIMHMYGLLVGTVSDPANLAALYRQDVPDIYSVMDPATYRDLIAVLVSEDVALNVQLSRDASPTQQQLYNAEDLELFSRPELQYLPMGLKVNTMRTYYRANATTESQRESFRNNVQRFVRDFAAAGGKIITGTDTVAFSLPGVGLRRELLALADAGVEPTKIIQTATKNVADLYRLRDLGTLERGKLADLQIIDGDPLMDLNQLANIELVMLGGEVVDRTFHPHYHNVFERPYPEDTGPGLVPVLGTIEPRMVVERAAGVDLTVTGARFDEFTSVAFDGVRLPTLVRTPNLLKVRVSADLLLRPGTYRVSLDDPRFLGEASEYYGFIVSYDTSRQKTAVSAEVSR